MISNEQTELAYLRPRVTDLENQLAEIEALSFTDRLTGLANRRRLYQLGTAALNDIQNKGGALALLCMDLDRFKQINDRLGHSAGDELLRQVTDRLKSLVEDIGVLARMRGDEFAILLYDTDLIQANNIAQCALKHLTRPFKLLDGHTGEIGVSLGIAVSGTGEIDFHDMMTRADLAMYSIKKAGGGIKLYDEAFHQLLNLQNEFESQFQKALQCGQIIFYHQPILGVQTNRIFGIEVLARWQHPNRGLLLPEIFLPLAEKSHRLIDLDLLALQMAVHQASLVNSQAAMASVNLSVHTFYNPDLLGEITGILNQKAIKANQITLEVTEDILLRDLQMAEEIMKRLRSLGVKVAVDNFGQNHGSLIILQQLPADILKIDRSLMVDGSRNLQNETVVRSLISIGQIHELTVIVEGIERESQINFLKGISSDIQVQGYFFGHPSPL